MSEGEAKSTGRLVFINMLSSAEEHNAEDLLLWKIRIPEVKHALLPLSSERPNPRMCNGLLFASTFSPAFFVAVDQHNGRVKWRREVPGFGGASVEIADGILYAKTAHTLYALKPDTGEVVWQFAPCPEPGEFIYGDPVVKDGRVYLGDRLEQFYCLEAATGRRIWQKCIPGGGVNATPLAAYGVVIGGNNAGRVVGLRTMDGEQVWEQQVDGPCLSPIYSFRGGVAVITNSSLTILDPRRGDVAEQFTWRETCIYAVAISEESALLLLRPVSVNRSSREGTTCEIVVIGRSSVAKPRLWAGPSSFAVGSSKKGVVCIGGTDEVSILEAGTGLHSHSIRFPQNGKCIGPPDVSEDTLYALDDGGSIYALRYPPTSQRHEEKVDN
jgi:outer membrane protein assembly factor BamB